MSIEKLGPRCMWSALVLLISIAPVVSRAAEIGWPEAVSRLAGERSKAETCAGLLKGHGSPEQIVQAQIVYGDAKANFDAVIAGLDTALSEGGDPKSLPTIETNLEHGTTHLKEFCQTAHDVLPKESGRKDILAEIVQAAVVPVIESLSAGVATLYNDHRKDDALTRETIKSQLEAAKWPAFAEVKPVK